MKVQAKMFQHRVQRGRELMKDSTVVICSLVRDCEKSLKQNIPKIEKLRNSFKDSQVVLVENDSKDRTKEVLADWALNSSNIHVISEDFGTVTIPEASFSHPKSKYFSRHRIEKMAKYRNIYLDYVRAGNFKPDFMIMIDLDVHSFPIKGIETAFGFEQKWDSINANGKKITPQSPLKPVFYDTYAFQEWGDNKPLQYDTLKKNQLKFAKLKEGDDFIKVKSGFNGLAIYKWDSISQLTYKAIPNEDDIVLFKCEHITFHEEMIKNGNSEIFLNPSMIVKYEKLGLKLYSDKIKEKLRK